jgi:hypothetical protein
MNLTASFDEMKRYSTSLSASDAALFRTPRAQISEDDLITLARHRGIPIGSSLTAQVTSYSKHVDYTSLLTDIDTLPVTRTYPVQNATKACPSRLSPASKSSQERAMADTAYGVCRDCHHHRQKQTLLGKASHPHRDLKMFSDDASPAWQ